MTIYDATRRLELDRRAYMTRPRYFHAKTQSFSYWMILADGTYRQGHSLMAELRCASFDAEDITASDWEVHSRE